MEKTLRLAGLFLIGFFIVSTTSGQIKCGMDKYQEMLHKKTLSKHDTDQFEQWMADKIQQRKIDAFARKQETITIPVVVHIIHSGEAIGVGSNISEDQVLSQIEVMNEDFRRMNGDASSTPMEFLPVAADIDVQFAMARRDPEGLPTNGIVRVNGGRPEWFLVDNYDLKALSNWPPEDYLNIWVASLGDGFLGYAQFPESTIGGLESASSNGFTDGVVIHHRGFGSAAKYPPADLFPQYNLGRTATHEVGHYLGLRHVWGDGGCSVDDFCADTPQASTDYAGLSDCTFPGPMSCGSFDMFQNYMDLTDDVCMNLFTEDQKTRMRIVLENSPRRVTLRDSKGAEPPIMASNDLGIRSIISPSASACSNITTAELEIRNYGDNPITSANIQVFVDDVLAQTETLTLNLDPLEITIATIDDIGLGLGVANELRFEISQVNSTADGNADNNVQSVSTTVVEEFSEPISLAFDEVPSNWIIENPDGFFTWELASAPNGEPTNQALFMNFFDYDLIEGDLDFFTSPVLDFTEGVGTLTFDVSYANFNFVENEGLFILVSQNCEDPFTRGDTVFFKLGTELSTTNSRFGPFVPSGPEEWRTETVDLSEFVGLDDVRVTFVAKNGFGNNMYIDNLNLISLPWPGVDIASLTSPSVASFNNSPDLSLEVRNSGAVTIETFDLNYVLDDMDTVSTMISTSLPLGETFEFNTPLGDLSEGTHRLYVEVRNPNDTVDFSLARNSRLLYFEVDGTGEVLPLKESFSSASSTWTIANPDNDVTWVVNEGQASIDLSLYEAEGEEDWLVSPIIDLSGSLNTALLNFDHAYPYNALRNDRLRVLLSRDGGESYDSVLYSRSGSTLQTGTFTTDRASRIFQNNSVPLDGFLGETDVRIAFVSTNANGDPIYLDNIQIFITDPFLEAENDVFPNPTRNGRFNLRFALDQRETVAVALYDATGHIVFENQLPNTLNQTYVFDIANRGQGIYFLKVAGESFSFVRRVMKAL